MGLKGCMTIVCSERAGCTGTAAPLPLVMEG